MTRKWIVAILPLTIFLSADNGEAAKKIHLAAGNFYPTHTVRDDGSSLYHYQQKVNELQRELRSKSAEIDALKKELLEKEEMISKLKKENETLVEQTIEQRSRIENLSRSKTLK